MIVIHATFPVEPDEREQALDLAADLAEQSRTEDGCVDYRVTTDVEDPNRLRFFEQYEDEAAFGAHAQSEHFLSFVGDLPDFLAGDPAITRFDVDVVSDVEL
jgi:quinol monooxygenase YgiN